MVSRETLKRGARQLEKGAPRKVNDSSNRPENVDKETHMRVLRTGTVALVLIGLTSSAFAGDLQQSIAKAAQTQQPPQQQQKAPSKSKSKALMWTGAGLFVGGMIVGLTAFINNENGEFAEFGEANAVNKELGTVGLATAFGGGVLMFLGSRPSNSSSATAGIGRVGVSKKVSW